MTELLGQGVNIVTGDYSRGAAGMWVEKGKIAYPVSEVTIAGNLRDMFVFSLARSSSLRGFELNPAGSLPLNAEDWWLDD